ncbi:Uncharacterized protein dnl_14590 [Desulfonema limicola]|uniref:Polysaccharide biosynthesis protein n=1 Tax=Desulfonema limicola TaxID=45656 RepID=A0A975B5K1_9BACT|nr:Uncharacterized protein dnl_14590 [Desulfonema limicola]
MALHTLATPHLSSLLQISVGLLFFSTINGAQIGALSGFEAFKTIAKLNLLAGIATFLFMIGGAYWAGVKGSVWALVASTAINWGISHLALKKEAKKANVPLIVKECLNEWKILFSFSLPLTCSHAISGTVAWGCNSILVRGSEGLANIAIISMANHWQSLLLFLPNAVGSLGLQIFSSFASKDDFYLLKRTIKVNVLFNFIVVSASGMIIILFSPIISASYGDSFRSGAGILIIACVTAAFLAVSHVFGQALVARGFVWLYFITRIMHGLTAFIITVFTVPFWGAYGLSIAFLAASIIIVLIQFLYVAMKIKSDLF